MVLAKCSVTHRLCEIYLLSFLLRKLRGSHEGVCDVDFIDFIAGDGGSL